MFPIKIENKLNKQYSLKYGGGTEWVMEIQAELKIKTLESSKCLLRMETKFCES